MKKKNSLFRQLAAALVLEAVLYLFYNTLFVFLAFPLLLWLCRKYMKRQDESRAKNNLNNQFRDMLLSLSAALRSGYSVENGLRQALFEMEVIYGEEGEICAELRIMLNQLNMGMNAEEVFSDFAGRSEIEDINTFAQIFKIAKRAGGDMTAIMQKTCADISARVETRNEIDVLISAKRLEQNIMLLMPAGIIVYMRISSNGFMDPLYKNAAGILIMTLCLGIYAAAWYLGRRITDINV